VTAYAIKQIHARQVLDSRGHPTVEAEVRLAGGAAAHASVPSGASTGRHEAHELRDVGAKRWDGLGVAAAVRNVVEQIGPALIGTSAADQRSVDEQLIVLDGSPARDRLGANALLAVSLAVARGAAQTAGMPLWRWLAGDRKPMLPMPMVNLISGGMHADQSIDIQDILVVPVGASNYPDALESVCAVHRATGELLRERGLTTLRADEGGYGPTLETNESALKIALASIERAGLAPGEDMALALDIAATHFYDPTTGSYRLAREAREVDADGLVDLVAGWAESYPIVSVEDPLAEDDWCGWVGATRRLGDRIQLVGDDLFATAPARVSHGVERGVANAVLVKMNQVGTLTETLDVVDIARRAGYAAVVSARSGETEDDALADLAVAAGGGQIKIGSVRGSERLAKYNRLLRIAEQFGADRYAGAAFLAGPAHARVRSR
jgi:enolase